MSLKPSAQRVQDALASRGFTNTVIELDASTRTSAEAAAAVGCSVAQIAKSLLFRAVPRHEAGSPHAADDPSSQGAGDYPVLIVASGINRVNLATVAEYLDASPVRPDAEYVREQTGFVIGGVPPIGHPRAMRTLLDRDLWQYEVIWAAAGHPNAVFQLTPDELAAITGGTVLTLT